MFERRNRISINVYGWDEKQVTGHLFQKSIYGAQSQASIANRAKYSDEEWDILGCETKATRMIAMASSPMPTNIKMPPAALRTNAARSRDFFADTCRL